MRLSQFPRVYAHREPEPGGATHYEQPAYIFSWHGTEKCGRFAGRLGGGRSFVWLTTLGGTYAVPCADVRRLATAEDAERHGWRLV